MNAIHLTKNHTTQMDLKERKANLHLSRVFFIFFLEKIFKTICECSVRQSVVVELRTIPIDMSSMDPKPVIQLYILCSHHAIEITLYRKTYN